MTLSSEQIEKLDVSLNRANVKERKQGGRQVSYVEVWHAIAECNRVFGFDRWTCETTHFECVDQHEVEIGENKIPGWSVTYVAKVRVIVEGTIVREGCGAGHGIDRHIGQAHESAIKEAESDALKRALRSFGNVFGLALYDKEQRYVLDDVQIKRQEEEIKLREDYIRGCKEHIEQYGHDWPKLLQWWNSDRQKEAHRKYLSDGEMEMLKALVLSKKPVEEAGQAVPQSEGTNEQR